ncbi:putative sodium-dependent multivitamin transporter [Phymastichus coffea]|uniref:putative sodium-dependent multivitamin transporter n=1 Tax=Phymastichus coffea TaxID=108790 RepID=UPI00273CE951|nr:putative sodium-dependent multivitamin transporter [Phymastichus coffea]
MEGRKKSMLQAADYVVLGVVMLVSAGIGVYYRFTGGKQKTIEEYFSANRSMSVLPLSIALMVSFVSAITVLGISGEIYAHGTLFAVHYIGIVAATVVVGYFYLPVFFELDSMSVYEYLERRFGIAARLTTSIANYIQLTLYTGVVLYAPSLAIEATTGLSSKTSITLIAVICIFYSTVGGIKAVLVTDIFQGVLMFASLVCILAVASSEIDGGLGRVWQVASQRGRLEFFDFRPDPTIRHTCWSLICGCFCLFCSLYGVNQVEVQRLKTVKTLRAARLALFMNVPMLVSFGLMTCFCGLVLFVVYKDCDPVRSGQVGSADRLMPHFAATKMAVYPGLAGLFISGIFSASLSTISAMLNSLAAVFLEDYLKRLYRRAGRSFPAEKEAYFGKVLAVSNGLICTSIAFLAGSLGSLITLTVSITGSIAGPVLGIFTLGMFFEGANEKGAVVGIVTALLTCMWASFGQPRPKVPPLPASTDGCNFTVLPAGLSVAEPPRDPSSYFYLYRISYMWYSPMGATITLVVGYLASLLFDKFSRERPIEPDPSLFTPMLAERIRRKRSDAAKTTSSQVLALEEANARRNQ